MESLEVRHEVTQDVVAPSSKFGGLLIIHDPVDIHVGVDAVSAEQSLLVQHQGMQVVAHRKERGATRVAIGIAQADSTIIFRLRDGDATTHLELIKDSSDIPGRRHVAAACLLLDCLLHFFCVVLLGVGHLKL